MSALGRWRAGEIETDARVLFCRTGGERVARLAMVDGSVVACSAAGFQLALPHARRSACRFLDGAVARPDSSRRPRLPARSPRRGESQRIATNAARRTRRAARRASECAAFAGVRGYRGSSIDPPAVHAADASRALIHRMCDVIRHRGPDDEGMWVDEGVALGHAPPEHHRSRRPGTSRSTTKTARSGSSSTARSTTSRSCGASSRRAGHRFYTSTDTEAIVHAYEQWGTDAIRAAARHVRPRHLGRADAVRCCVARDRDRHQAAALRDGRRPAVLRLRDQVAARARPDMPRELDLDALDHYLSFLYTPRDASIFRGVHKLPPGHLLTLADGRARDRALLADSGRRAVHAAPKTRPRARCATCSTDAVRSHLISDVPLGAFLSGGIDSSLVVGLMARGLRRAGEDVLDRVRRAGVRRAGARARASRSTSAPITTSSSSSRTASRSSIDADRALRRAVRRLLGDPDVVRVARWRAATSPWCCRATAATSCSAATTATCRTRASWRSIDTARRALRRVAAIAAARLPHGARGQELPAPRRTRRAGTLSRFDPLLRRRREARSADARRAQPPRRRRIPRRGSRGTSSGSQICRGPAR